LSVWLIGNSGRCGMVPTFTVHRLMGLASSYSPAASPRLRRRHFIVAFASPWFLTHEDTAVGFRHW
jgi:hypothetical protein